jgi:predicted ester cyclase
MHKWSMYLSAVTDLQMPIDDIAGEKDKVASGSGVLTAASCWAYQPVAKLCRRSATSILRLVDGKISENWEEHDRLGLLQQLGAIPQIGKWRSRPLKDGDQRANLIGNQR